LTKFNQKFVFGAVTIILNLQQIIQDIFLEK